MKRTINHCKNYLQINCTELHILENFLFRFQISYENVGSYILRSCLYFRNVSWKTYLYPEEARCNLNRKYFNQYNMKYAIAL